MESAEDSRSLTIKKDPEHAKHSAPFSSLRDDRRQRSATRQPSFNCFTLLSACFLFVVSQCTYVLSLVKCMHMLCVFLHSVVVCVISFRFLSQYTYHPPPPCPCPCPCCGCPPIPPPPLPAPSPPPPGTPPSSPSKALIGSNPSIPCCCCG